MTPLVLSPAVRRAYDRMAADFRRVLADRFVALIAYGPASASAFATAINADDLLALTSLAGAWHHDGLETPLVMTPDEFRRSLDAFPVEYQAMIDRHIVIAGADPFDGARIVADDLRRACEILAKSHLIQLRQGWLDAGGHDEDLAELIGRSAPPLRVLLTNLARLDGRPWGDAAALSHFAADRIGMPGDLVVAVLALEERPDDGHRLVPRLAEYLAAAERLWTFVDTWRAR